MSSAIFVGATLIALQLGASVAYGESTTPGNAAFPTLTVVLANQFAESLNYVAKANGFFTKRGVSVVFNQSTPGMVPSVIASGVADLGVNALGSPLSLDASGKKVSIVFAFTGGGQGGSVVGAKGGVKSIEVMKSKPDCRIGTLPAGTSAAGFAVVYKRSLALSCDIVPFQDAASELGALVANRVDVLVGSYPTFDNAVSQGKISVLVDTRDPEQYQKYLGEFFPEVVLFGSADNLNAKRPAVVAYLKALVDANNFIESTPSEAVATSMKTLPELEDRLESLVKSDVETLQAYRFRGSERGFISEKDWTLALSRVADWGLPNFSTGSAVFSYRQAVDMSYYKAAFGD